MIDTRTESLLTLAELGELVRKHVATVYRWSTTGCRGVVLETLQVGGTRYTSHEALQRFCERLGAATPVRQAQTRKAAEKAGAELETYGV